LDSLSEGSTIRLWRSRAGMFQGRDFGHDVASPKLGSAQAIEWRDTSEQATSTSILHPQATSAIE
jgi:hypothetical protein